MKLREITETRYYGSDITVEQVSKMYWEVYEEDRNILNASFSIARPRLYEYGAIMSIHTYTKDVQRAVTDVKNFLNEKNLPYTDIETDEYKGVTVIVKYINRNR